MASQRRAPCDTRRFLQQSDIKEEAYSFTLSFDDGLNPNNTQRISHDRSGLGTGAAPRDEADIQVGLDPTGYKVLDGTSRLRAYRFWELISSDTANIIIEPDFHWDVLSGDVTSVTFKGVHYEIIVDIKGFKWMIQTTEKAEVGDRIGISIKPDEIQIMKKSEYSGLYGDYSSFSEEFDELSDPNAELTYEDEFYEIGD